MGRAIRQAKTQDFAVLLSQFLGLTWVLTSCGQGVDIPDIESDEGKVDGVVDFGKNAEPVDSTTLDPEVEAFWARVDEEREKLPRRESNRLIQNLKELRERFDRETAEIVLEILPRLQSGGDLEAIISLASYELALLLEQRSGDELNQNLRDFRDVSAAEAISFFDGLGTTKPVDTAEKFLEQAEEVEEQIVVTPEFKPSPGNYSQPQVIRIETETPNAVIRYTLDGSDPDASSPVYSEPFTVGVESEFVVIKAIALRDDLTPSAVFFGSYNIILPTLPALQLSVEPGVYSSDQAVAVSSSEPEVLITYTTDGSTPSEDSEKYTEAIQLVNGDHIEFKFRAFKELSRPSPVLVATYHVDSEAPVLKTGAPGFAVDSVAVDGAEVTWDFAEDNVDASDVLTYRVVVVVDELAELADLEKVLGLIENPEEAIQVSGPIPGRTGLNRYRISDLLHSTTYGLGIVVQDQAGNSLFYGSQGFTTLSN